MLSILQAAELLNHPHLQPYILKINSKLNNPRRHTLSPKWPESNRSQEMTFQESDVSDVTFKWRRQSTSNNRTLNPSVMETERDSLWKMHEFRDEITNQELADSFIRSDCDDIGIDKEIATKVLIVPRTPRLTSGNINSTPARRTLSSMPSLKGTKKETV